MTYRPKHRRCLRWWHHQWGVLGIFLPKYGTVQIGRKCLRCDTERYP